MAATIWQCQECGNKIEKNTKKNYDAMYAYGFCDCCNKKSILLNIGKEEDWYEFYNLNLDSRYY